MQVYIHIHTQIYTYTTPGMAAIVCDRKVPQSEEHTQTKTIIIDAGSTPARRNKCGRFIMPGPTILLDISDSEPREPMVCDQSALG
jgi:hypothetical protein